MNIYNLTISFQYINETTRFRDCVYKCDRPNNIEAPSYQLASNISIISDIQQLDGNISIISDIQQVTGNSSIISDASNNDSLDELPKIPVVISDRQNTNKNERLPPVIFNISPTKEQFPTIATMNTRSLFPKINNVITDMAERQIDILILSEIWQKKGCLSQEAEIEKVCELKSVSLLTKARKGKRGGGVAVMVASEKYSIEKIDNYQNENLETLWTIIRPKSAEFGIFPIIACNPLLPSTNSPKHKG